MTGSDHPPSGIELGRVVLMFEQLRDDVKLMHGGLNRSASTVSMPSSPGP